MAQLLRISSNPNQVEGESFVVVTQKTSQQGGNQKGRGTGSWLHCMYCDKSGHTRDTCWALHGQPSHSNRPTAHVAQAQGNGILPLTPANTQGAKSVMLSGSDYDEYLQYQASRQKSSTVTSVA